jgi:asparaginyl-tRNA synthetase
MIEPVVAHLELDGLMDLAEAFITHIVTRVLELHRNDLKVIGRDVSKLEAVIAPSSASTTSVIPSEAQSAEPRNPRISPEAPQTLAPATDVSSRPERSEVEGPAVTASSPTKKFPRLTYDQAHDMLEKAFAEGKIENPHKYGDDFGSPDETYISSQFDKPVMVNRYPAAIKAFYMQPDPHDPTKALCVDVLAPEGYGEIIGGSQRVDSYDLLKQRIEDHNLPLAAFQWYLYLRKYGS